MTPAVLKVAGRLAFRKNMAAGNDATPIAIAAMSKNFLFITLSLSAFCNDSFHFLTKICRRTIVAHP
jgi:hypothetical protein